MKLGYCTVCHQYHNLNVSACPPIESNTAPFCCPVCHGQGKVLRPPHVAGDQMTWFDNGEGPYQCQACSGTGVVWR